MKEDARQAAAAACHAMRGGHLCLPSAPNRERPRPPQEVKTASLRETKRSPRILRIREKFQLSTEAEWRKVKPG